MDAFTDAPAGISRAADLLGVPRATLDAGLNHEIAWIERARPAGGFAVA